MRSFTIRVDVVDRSRFGSMMTPLDITNGNYCITIDESQLKEMNVPAYAVAFHELGHLLATEFQMPRHTNYRFSPDIAEATMAREHEAWDVAEALTKIIQVRRRAINTYEQEFWMRSLLEDLFKTDDIRTEKGQKQVFTFDKDGMPTPVNQNDPLGDLK